MSSKLITPSDFNRPARMRVELPYPESQVAATVTVILRKDGRVELSGAVSDLTFGMQLLKHGAQRLQQRHQQQAEALGKRMGVSEASAPAEKTADEGSA